MRIHGGEIYGLNKNVIDFSVNINPLGTPEGVLRAGHEALSLAAVYPDAACGQLRQALAHKHGLTPEQVVCGNGAGELIFALCQGLKPKSVMVTAPAFTEYKQAAMALGAKVITYSLHPENGFAPGQDIIKAIQGADLAFLCNPHNPTGLLWQGMEAIVAACPGTYIVVDECFMDFVENSQPMAACVNKYKNLIVLKAFTKTYAMAGIRLGYCLCSPTVAERLGYTLQPWNVSVVAQHMGLAALKEQAYLAETLAFLGQERQRLVAALTALGLRVYRPYGNFIFFYYNKADLYSKLLSRGILIRCCSSFDGLQKGYYRIGIGTRQADDRLIEALRQVIENG